MVDSCCNGVAMMGVMPEMSKIFPLVALAGNTASTMSGAISSDFFSPEYLMRGCELFGTVNSS